MRGRVPRPLTLPLHAKKLTHTPLKSMPLTRNAPSSLQKGVDLLEAWESLKECTCKACKAMSLCTCQVLLLAASQDCLCSCLHGRMLQAHAQHAPLQQVFLPCSSTLAWLQRLSKEQHEAENGSRAPAVPWPRPCARQDLLLHLRKGQRVPRLQVAWTEAEEAAPAHWPSLWRERGGGIAVTWGLC